MVKSNRGQDKITPANHGDELDVLEAVAKIGYEKGVDLLSSDQKQLLVKSGREISQTNSDLTGKISQDNVIGLTKNIVLMILEVIESKIESILKDGEWDKLSNNEKMHMRSDFFQAVFGVSPDLYTLQLYESFNGGSR